MNDTYPKPRQPTHLQLVRTGQPDPDFSGDRRQYEENVFKRADHFNVVRYGSHNGSQINTTPNFAAAVYLAVNNERALLYAVCSATGEAFCMPKDEFNHYAEIWLAKEAAKHAES